MEPKRLFSTFETHFILFHRIHPYIMINHILCIRKFTTLRYTNKSTYTLCYTDLKISNYTMT
jgi:hypothetical protein